MISHYGPAAVGGTRSYPRWGKSKIPILEGGMIRLETIVELKFLNSSFSSSNCSIHVVRGYPLLEIRLTVPCRAIRGKSSDSRQQYLSQQYPPPLLP